MNSGLPAPEWDIVVTDRSRSWKHAKTTSDLLLAITLGIQRVSILPFLSKLFLYSCPYLFQAAVE